MPKSWQLSFEGQAIFCGIDVHKQNWRVNIRNEDFELEDYSQEPCEKVLMNHLRKGFPNASYQATYEAGLYLHCCKKKSNPFYNDQ
jgi:transposase